MNGFRISAAIVAALAACALTAAAQGTITSDPKNTDAKKAPQKAVEKKAPPKKAPPRKKVDSKIQPTAGGGTVQKYEAGKAPDLKDAKGNTVPSAPDAYDISSATKKK